VPHESRIAKAPIAALNVVTALVSNDIYIYVRSVPTVKLHLAAIRVLCDGLVVS
jgi:hypothetical protein